MSKKNVKASVQPQYFRAVDLMLAAVEYTRKGLPNRAAKALAEAAQDPQVDEAVEQLNGQQQAMQDQDLEQLQQAPQQGIDQQQQTSRALARLIKASQQQIAEGQDEDDGDGDEDDSDADFDEDEEDESETADVDEDDLSIDFGQDDQDDESGEMAVQASVKARLNRAARNKARRG